MSLTALNSTIYNLTLDGLINIDADTLTVDGEAIDATNLVPYTGAIKTVNLADQNIKSTFYPVDDEDLVNLLALKQNIGTCVKFIGSTRNTNLGTYGLSGGDLTANSSLTVNGITSLVGNITASSNLNVSGLTTFNGNITANSSLNVNGITSLIGNITASSNLNVSGLTTLVRGQSSFVPTTGIDLTNKTYVDNSVSTASSLFVPYSGASTLLNLGSNSLVASTARFSAITSATPSLALGVDASGNLNSFPVPSGANFPFNGTVNINGALKTIQDPTQYNPTLDANSYFITGVFPTTYVFSSPTWIVNPVSGTTANIQLDPSVFYFSTTTKYVISFTGIFGTSASWTGTVFNNSTSTIVSDAPIAITTTSQNLTMTFTPGSNNPTIYLRFDGASGTLRITNLSIKQVDVEVMGNLAISSQIDSNLVLANGKIANLANGLKVNQTSISTAPSLTTASLPAGVAASTLSGTYTLTATAGGTTFGMWLGSSFTYTAGAKYTYTFTGFSTNATASQAMILYTNTYSGGVGTSIGDYIVNVPITSSTVSGSFTATSNNNLVWYFVSSTITKSISFATFTLTRADTHISGIATLPTNTGTAIAGLGLNSSNQIVNTAVPPNFSAVSVGSVPYESSSDVFSNSIITQGLTDFGYTGASFTASTGIGSITFSSPTYTANSSASFQGIITLPALPATALNLPCTATFTALSFPFFAVSPYPYFTLTNGSTVVYTSATGASGTIAMPFTPTSTTLFITLYFKAPPTPQTAGIFTWTNFTITTPIITTSGNNTITGNNTVNKNLTVNGDTTLITTSTGNLTVRAGNTITKVGGNSGQNYSLLTGDDAGSSPYLTFYQNNIRRMYVGNASATDAIIASENSAQLVFATQGSNRMFIDTAGNVDVSSRELRISQLNGNCQIRMKDGTYNIASMLHQNGRVLYFLGTNSGDWTGGWTTFRPLEISLEGGGCTMQEGLTLRGGNLTISAGKSTIFNQPFVIVGAVGGASIGYGAGTNFGQGGYLYAYTSAGYTNTPGSGWASNNGRFWATLLGRYQVNFCFYWNNFAAGSRVVMRHFNSGGALLEDRYCALNGGGIGADTTQNYSTIVYMSAGSWLEFSFQSGSGTLYFGGITHTHCSFHYIC